MAQTAVEFLFEQVCNLDWKNLTGEKKTEILEQAKAMEKEQIISAWNGHKYNKWGTENTFVNGEHYYKEIYEAPKPKNK